MYSTRRFSEHLVLGRVLPRAAIALLLLGAAANCSEGDVTDASSVDDAGSPSAEAGPSNEAGPDAADASRDAPFDGAPLEVTCTATPCARDLSASWSESFCALLDDGHIACWGRNASGELGSDAGSASATPTLVDGMTNAVSLDRTCAVVADGNVVCWGPAESPAWVESTHPKARSVRVGYGFACAVLEDGNVACWGQSSTDGILAYADAGIGSTVPPSVVPLGGPVEEIAIARRTTVQPPDIFCPSCPPTIIEDQGVIARRSSGEVLSWGMVPLIGRPTEQKPDPNPGLVAVNHADHLFGGYGACLVDGTSLGCWGYGRDDLSGNLGPLPVALVPDAVDATLADFGTGHFGRGCAVTPVGDVYCWGVNDYGQLGDGTTDFHDLPVKVKNLPEPIVRVRATAKTTCALGVSGRIHCWGDDAFGQRGQKTPFTKAMSPLPVELP